MRAAIQYKRRFQNKRRVQSKEALPLKLVDLTRLLEPIDISEFPEQLRPLYRIICPEVEYIGHAKGAKIMGEIFGCSEEHLPDGEGWAEENLSISTHLGTHVDAPWHYGSKTSNKPALTVEQIPLSDLFLDGVVLDLSHLCMSAAGIEIKHLEEALRAIDYQIKPRDAVLIKTGHDQFHLTDPRRYAYPGMLAASAVWLAEQGALVLGTDALGFDRPFPAMIEAWKRSGDKSHIWDGHYALRNYQCYVVQQLSNLEALPASGFKVSFFPLKLAGASAAPARVVAFLED